MGTLNIKNVRVANKARQLAKLKGTTITEAVRAALDESLKAAAIHSEAVKEDRRRRAD